MTVIDNVATCNTKRVKVNTSIDLMEKYLKNLGQVTNSLKYSRQRDCISINSLNINIKSLNMTR